MGEFNGGETSGLKETNAQKPKIEVSGDSGSMLIIDPDKLAGVVGDAYPGIREVGIRISPDVSSSRVNAVAIGTHITIFEDRMVADCKKIYRRFLGEKRQDPPVITKIVKTIQTLLDEHRWARKFVPPGETLRLIGDEWPKDLLDDGGKRWGDNLATGHLKRYAALVIGHELSHVNHQKDFLMQFGWAVGAVVFMALGTGMLEMWGRDVWKDLSDLDTINYFTAMVLVGMQVTGIAVGSFATKVADEATAYRDEVKNFERILGAIDIDTTALWKKIGDDTIQK